MTLLIIGACFYFLPTIIGFRKRNAGAIFVLNLLLGWTIVGWIVALVWALTQDVEPRTILIPAVAVPTARAWTCTACRATVVAGDAFCPSCGTRIAWPG